MTTTTNKQGKKDQNSPHNVSVMFSSPVHVQNFRSTRWPVAAKPCLASPCCWSIPCWALQREPVADSRSSDSMPSPSEPSLRRWERRGYWRPWEEQRREGLDLRRPDVASLGSVTSTLTEKKRRVCAGLPPMEEKRRATGGGEQEGVTGISGAKMNTSGGLINRDLEQMSKINGEIMFFLQ